MGSVGTVCGVAGKTAAKASVFGAASLSCLTGNAKVFPGAAAALLGKPVLVGKPPELAGNELVLFGNAGAGVAKPAVLACKAGALAGNATLLVVVLKAALGKVELREAGVAAGSVVERAALWDPDTGRGDASAFPRGTKLVLTGASFAGPDKVGVYSTAAVAVDRTGSGLSGLKSPWLQRIPVDDIE
jgi:hypothetical protein